MVDLRVKALTKFETVINDYISPGDKTSFTDFRLR